jgi:hypothetical protein
MICNPSTSQFRAVIAEADSDKCNNTQDYTTNTCRNVVTLNEILNGAYTGDLSDFTPEYGEKTQDSMKLREYCLRNAMGVDLDDVKGDEKDWNIRSWTKETSNKPD